MTVLRRSSLPAVVGVVCFLLLAIRVRTTRFFTDESGWVTAGGYYAALVEHGDLNATSWDGNGLSTFGEFNPPLGKLLIGFSLRAGAAPPWSGLHDWTLSDAENAAAGHVPPERVLIPARLGMACLGALCCVLLFMLGRSLAGPWCGVLAAGGLLLNRLFSGLATQAMLDVPLAAFLLATCLAACYLLESDDERSMRAACYCGLFAGFAGLVKINGLLIGVGLVLTVLLLRFPRFGVRRTLALGSTCLVTAIAVGYLFTPNYWPQLRDIRPAVVRSEASALRRNGFPPGAGGDEGRFAAFNATYPQLANLTRPLRLPLLFVRWKLVLDSVVVVNPEWAIKEPRAVVQASELFRTYASFPGESVFVIIGFVMLVRQILSTNRSRSSDVAVVVVAFFLVNYSLILAFQRLAWDRYYLPTVMSYQIPAALAAIRMGEWAKKQVPWSKPESTPSPIGSAL
jgi:4-amino-4-deoxy-L-arabinose transferase-like glycosyltransferase